MCLTASKDDAEAKQRAEGYIQELLSETSWFPDMAASFAGAIKFTKYGFVRRRLMRSIAGREGFPTDTSTDYEFTNWNSVGHFAEDFSRHLTEVSSPAV